jgi:hypothetical protein
MGPRFPVLALAAAAMLAATGPAAAHTSGINIVSHGAVNGPNIAGMTYVAPGHGPAQQLGGGGSGGRGGPSIQRKK